MFFFLHSNLSTDNIISAQRWGLKTGMENYIFGLKLAQDLKNGRHTHTKNSQEYPPSPRGMKTTQINPGFQGKQRMFYCTLVKNSKEEDPYREARRFISEDTKHNCCNVGRDNSVQRWQLPRGRSKVLLKKAAMVDSGTTFYYWMMTSWALRNFLVNSLNQNNNYCTWSWQTIYFSIFLCNFHSSAAIDQLIDFIIVGRRVTIQIRRFCATLNLRYLNMIYFMSTR